jgi:hypothetical protein
MDRVSLVSNADNTVRLRDVECQQQSQPNRRFRMGNWASKGEPDLRFAHADAPSSGVQEQITSSV